MKRAAAWLLLTVAALYSAFCLVLIFVGSFTTTTIFPGDHDSGKATGFSVFSFFFLVAAWMFGSFLCADSEHSK